jgi:small-conductance mechanosensitive channel
MDLFSENDLVARILSSDILIRIGKAALYYLVGILIIRLTSFLTRRLTSSKVSRQSRMILNKIVTYVGMSVLLVVILAELGVNLAALLGAAGILGLAVGVASQKSLGNMVSGLFLLSERSFEIGDVIKVGDKVGIVHDVDLLAVKMRTFDNLLVRIPNETLISTEVINITRYPIRRMDFEFSVPMDTDLTSLETLLRDSAESNPVSLEEPKPIFLLKKWDHDGIAVLFGAWFLKEDFIELKNSMFRDITTRLKDANITVSIPRIRVESGPAESTDSGNRTEPE